MNFYSDFGGLTDKQLLEERAEAWLIFTEILGGRGIEEAEYIDQLDAEIEERGIDSVY